jgi:hypothetical protein
MGGQSVVDSTRPHSGHYSLHSHIDPVDAGAPDLNTSIQAYLQFPSPVYVRVFVYLPSMPQPQALESFLGMQQNQPPYPGIGFALENAVATFSDWVSTPAATWTAPSFPTGQWVCVEWAITAGTQGSVQTSINSNPTISAQDVQVPPLGILTLGSTFYPATSPQPAFDLWTDDLFVDTQPIGCTR